MFKRDRGFRTAGVIISALALIAVISFFSWLSLAEYNSQRLIDATYQQHAQQDRANASEKIAQTCRGRNFITTRECIKTALETYYAQQSTDQDLQAQKDMAHWAKLVFWATVFTGLVGGAAVIYIAKDINVGREIGQAQTRAYIDITKFMLTTGNTAIWPCKQTAPYFAIGKVNAAELHFRAKIKNLGVTPARNVRVFCRISVMRSGPKNTIHHPSVEWSVVPQNFGYVPQGEEATGKSVMVNLILENDPLIESEKFKLRTGDQIRALVRCEFFDVFGRFHFVETEFESPFGMDTAGFGDHIFAREHYSDSHGSQNKSALGNYPLPNRSERWK